MILHCFLLGFSCLLIDTASAVLTKMWHLPTEVPSEHMTDLMMHR